MATATILLPPGLWTPGDGSTNNVGPGRSVRQGSQATRKVMLPTLDFDGAGTTIESAHVQLRMPSNYGSALTAKIQWMSNATSGTVKWQVEVAATNVGDADTPLEHAFATANVGASPSVNATEARRLNEESITLTNADSVVAGEFVQICLSRDPNNDTCTADAEVVMVVLEYTTA